MASAVNGIGGRWGFPAALRRMGVFGARVTDDNPPATKLAERQSATEATGARMVRVIGHSASEPGSPKQAPSKVEYFFSLFPLQANGVIMRRMKSGAGRQG